MANNDMFAPPTEEELQQNDLFAPPTEQELKQSTPEEKSKPGIFSKIGSSIIDSIKEGNGTPHELVGSTLQKLIPKLEMSDADPMPYLAGAQQGLSVGASDEAAGGIGAVADMAAGNSPDLANESSLDKYKRLYKEYRDIERKRLATEQKNNPEAYMAGDIGASMLLPYGKVAQGAKAIAPSSKVVQGLATAMPVGFAEGLGRSEADNIPDVLRDARDNAALSSVIPLGLATTKGIANTAKALTPTNLKEQLGRAYDLGKQGLNIRQQPVINGLVNELKDTVEQKVSKPIQELNETFNSNKVKIDKDLANLEQQAKQTVDDQTLQQSITNEALKNEVGNKVAEKAQDIQKNVMNLKNSLSKGYSAVDSLAEKDKITINTRDFIKQFVSDLGNESEMDDTAITSLYKKLDKYNGEISIPDFNSLKREINKYTAFNPMTPRTRGLAKRAYGQLNETYANQLEQMGRQDLATMTKELNKSWSAMSGFDDFVESGVDRNLKQVYPEQETVKSITNLAKDGPENQGTNQKFMDYLTNLFPNENPEDLKKLAKSYQNTKSFAPNVQSKEQQLAGNEEYQKLLQLKNAEPGMIQQKMSQFSGSPESVNKKILNLTPNMDSKLSSNLGNQQEIDDLFNVLENTKGKDYVNAAKNEISDKLLTYNTLKAANPGQTFDVTTKAQQIRSAYDLLTQGGLNAMANRVGRSTKSFGGVSNLFSPKNMGSVAGATSSIVDKNNMKQDNIRQYVEKATPEDLQTSAQDVRSKYGKGGEHLATQIEKMADKDTQGRRAATFSIMQDPNNRKMLRDNDADVETTEDSGEE